MIALDPVAGVIDVQVERLGALRGHVNLHGLLSAAKHFGPEQLALLRRDGKHYRAGSAARPLVVVHADPGRKSFDRLRRTNQYPAVGMGSQPMLELPLSDRQGRFEDRLADLQLFGVLAKQRQPWLRPTGSRGSGNRLREGHEVVETATSAVSPVNRVCLPRLRLIQFQIEVLHLLDQRRILAAGVLERQQRVEGRIVQIPLDVPDHLQAGLGVQPTPVLRFDIGLSLDIPSLELPTVAIRGKRLAVIAEAERQRRPNPAVEPGLRGRFAGLRRA